MAFFKKSLGRSSGNKLKSSASSTTVPPWMLNGGADAKPSGGEELRQKASEDEAEAERRQRLNVNRYAAGGGGAAFTQIRKQEQSRVEKMQNQTFTRWVNLQLAGTGAPPLQDLQALASGDNLLRLLAVLSGKNPAAAASSSSGAPSASGKEVGIKKTGLGSAGSRFQSMGNVEKAFNFMKEEKIPLVGIGPQDISQGNLKLILGMMWSIIQHYRLADLFNDEEKEEPSATTTSSAIPVAVATDVHATDDKQSGVVADDVKKSSEVNATVAKSDNSTSTDTLAPLTEPVIKDDKKAAKKQKKDKKADKGKTDKTEASPQAQIPQKPPQPSPTAASQTPKPSAAPTRVTQHTLETSLLEWAQDKLASSHTVEQIQIRSVKELFADGRALPALVNAIVPGSVNVSALDVRKPIENNKLALNIATEKLEVPKLLDSEDLASGADLDGLSLILYLSYLKQAASRKPPVPEPEPIAEPKTTPKTDDESVQPAPAADSISQLKSESTEAISAKESNDEGKGRKSQEPNLDAPSAKLSPPNPEKASAVEPAPVEPTDKQDSEDATASKEDSQATKTHEPADLQAPPEPSAVPVEIKQVEADDHIVETAKADLVSEQAAEAEAVIKTASEPHSAPSVDPAQDAAPSSDEKQVEETVKASEDGIRTEAESTPTAADQTEDKAEQPKPTQEEAETARSTQAETAVEKRDADGGAAPEEESLATESKSSIKKKKKKSKKEGSKVKKSKKDGSKKGEEKKKKKKKKSKKEETSSKETEAITEGKQSGEMTTAAAKAAAKLPHSRIPGRDTTDLSYLAGGSAPLKKDAYKVAAIPERKPKQQTEIQPDDPVSAFWYS